MESLLRFSRLGSKPIARTPRRLGREQPELHEIIVQAGSRLVGSNAAGVHPIDVRRSQSEIDSAEFARGRIEEACRRRRGAPERASRKTPRKVLPIGCLFA